MAQGIRRMAATPIGRCPRRVTASFCCIICRPAGATAPPSGETIDRLTRFPSRIIPSHRGSPNPVQSHRSYAQDPPGAALQAKLVKLDSIDPHKVAFLLDIDGTLLDLALTPHDVRVP